MCVHTADADWQAAMKTYKARFNRWTKITQVRLAPSTVVCYVPRPMFYIGPPPEAGGAASSDGGGVGVVVLLIFSQLSKQVFVVENRVRPAVGDLITLRPSWPSIRSRTSLASLWCKRAGWSAYSIDYEQVGLCAYRVKSLELTLHLERQHVTELATEARARHA